MTINLRGATDATVDAAVEFAERTDTCIYSALVEADVIRYCPCRACAEAEAAQIKAEQYAEGAWLRAAESAGVCYGVVGAADGGCLCC